MIFHVCIDVVAIEILPLLNLVTGSTRLGEIK